MQRHLLHRRVTAKLLLAYMPKDIDLPLWEYRRQWKTSPRNHFSADLRHQVFLQCAERIRCSELIELIGAGSEYFSIQHCHPALPTTSPKIISNNLSKPSKKRYRPLAPPPASYFDNSIGLQASKDGHLRGATFPMYCFFPWLAE